MGSITTLIRVNLILLFLFIQSVCAMLMYEVYMVFSLDVPPIYELLAFMVGGFIAHRTFKTITFEIKETRYGA